MFEVVLLRPIFPLDIEIPACIEYSIIG